LQPAVLESSLLHLDPEALQDRRLVRTIFETLLDDERKRAHQILYAATNGLVVLQAAGAVYADAKLIPENSLLRFGFH
jgi:hypothetical protein